MDLVVACAAVGGLGLALVMSALVPARPRLEDVLAQLGVQRGSAAPRPRSLDEAVGRLLQGAFGSQPGRRLSHSTRLDLALVELDPTTFLAARVLCGVVGGLLGPALALVDVLAGSRPPWQLPSAVALALGAAGFFIPALDLRRRASRRRREFRHALSAFLDVVALGLAAGEMISGALNLASRSGEGWCFALLRRLLSDADQRGVTPWDALARAASERGLRELAEVAASVRLAGTDGGQVRRTLIAKGEGLRVRTLSDLQIHANEATSHMVLPLVGFVVGFLVLMAFPALSQILMTK